MHLFRNDKYKSTATRVILDDGHHMAVFVKLSEARQWLGFASRRQESEIKTGVKQETGDGIANVTF
jgi:hypothetical protein